MSEFTELKESIKQLHDSHSVKVDSRGEVYESRFSPGEYEVKDRLPFTPDAHMNVGRRLRSVELKSRLEECRELSCMMESAEDFEQAKIIAQHLAVDLFELYCGYINLDSWCTVTDSMAVQKAYSRVIKSNYRLGSAKTEWRKWATMVREHIERHLTCVSGLDILFDQRHFRAYCNGLWQLPVFVMLSLHWAVPMSVMQKWVEGGRLSYVGYYG